MKPIFKRPRAEADLVDIWNFIAEDSEAQADVFIDELDEKLRSLAENPHIVASETSSPKICGAFRSARLLFSICRWWTALRSSACCTVRGR